MGVGRKVYSSRKKGKSPHDFLFVEFPKGDSFVRIRYRVVQCIYSGYGLQIGKRGSKLTGHSRGSQKRIEIGTYISEGKLFETLARRLSEQEKIPADSIAFRWENRSLKMPLEAPSELNV